MLLKREMDLIKRYVACTTNATLAIRITPVGKRIVMFREFIPKSTKDLLVIDRKLESENGIRYQEKDAEYLCRVCGELKK